jgi:hypothetical protein
MIKEEQRIKEILNKYRRQEDKGREKDNKRKQTQKTTLTPLKRKNIQTLLNCSFWMGYFNP